VASYEQDLHRYSDMNDVEVAPDNPDVRGWYVQGGTRDLGKVDDLVVDKAEMKVRYLEVDLDRSAFNLDDGRKVLLPVERVELDHAAQRVLVSGIGLEQFASLPTFDSITSARYEGAGTTGRAERDTGDQRLTRAEEELRVGTRREQTGEVKVGKHVETERVSEPVTRQREQVNVERRPVEGDARGEARFGDDEIRVPVVEEEVVVDKRPVVKEELVVSKDTVTEQDTVEADVRRERFDVDRTGADTRAGDRAADRSSIARPRKGGR
jgi:uncharacterized protein (TIGR02271 family)